VKQALLPFARPQKKPASATVDRYEQGNRSSAELILADVERWGGEEAGLVQWARATMERQKP